MRLSGPADRPGKGAMIQPGRYTSGRIAVANLSASIEALERHRVQGAGFEDLRTLSDLLFLRGDLLGWIADHDQAERAAIEAVTTAPDPAAALFLRGRLAARFHRFEEAGALLDGALAAGFPVRAVDAERATVFQATGRYGEAMWLRERLAVQDPGMPTLGALASLQAEMDRWVAAERSYETALAVDTSLSPLPCGQLLFEWGVSAMRRGALDRAEEIFTQLDAVLPQHVPARGHRAEVALAHGHADAALALITPLLEVSDDPRYRGTSATILAARGDREAAARDADRATAAYELLLARRPEAYADHAAAFFAGIGNRPERAVELALLNARLRDTARARRLLARARDAAARAAERATHVTHEGGSRRARTGTPA